MDIKDLIILPIFLFIVYAIIFNVVSKIKDKKRKSYFLQGITLKIIGSISLGLIYQFYYGGGDTFNFFHDSYIIWDAFMASPVLGLSIFNLTAGNYEGDSINYTIRMYFFIDPQSLFIIKLSAFLGLFCLHTYSVISILFSLISFAGIWAIYLTLEDIFPKYKPQIAFSVLFLPSVFFWGSGLLKDTICLGAVGGLFYCFYFGILKGRKVWFHVLFGFLFAYILYRVKLYILLCFIPASFLWLFFKYRANIRSPFLRFISLPFVLLLSIVPGTFVMIRVAQDNSRYNLEKIAATTKESAEWLKYVASTQGGSVYDLGPFDGTIGGTLTKLPNAVWLGLFRPYIFEARNPFMLLSALETALFLYLFIRIVFSKNVLMIFNILAKEPVLIFCVVYSITLAFGIAVASSNFGTLVRYRIAFIPFFVTALLVIHHKLNKPKKFI